MSDRASYLHRRRSCLGSKAAEAKAVKLNPALADDKTKWSESGDKLHAALHANKFDDITQEEMKLLTWLVSTAADVEQDILGECERPVRVYKEVELTIPLADGVTLTGHPDKVVVAKHPKHGWFALVLDWKTGHADVDSAEDNDQLRAYALGVPYMEQLQDITLSKVFVRIIQKFATHLTACYTMEDLELARRDILAVYEASNTPDAPRTPSPDACRYCRALGTSACPETQQAIELSTVEPLVEMTGEQIAQRLHMFSLAESIIKKEEATYKAMLIANPGCIPGWEIKPGQIMRSIEDLAGAHARLYDVLGLKDNPAVWTDTLKCSVPEVQAALQEARGLPELAAKKLLKELLGPLLVEKQKAESLAPVSKKALKAK